MKLFICMTLFTQRVITSNANTRSKIRCCLFVVDLYNQPIKIGIIKTQCPPNIIASLIPYFSMACMMMSTEINNTGIYTNFFYN